MPQKHHNSISVRKSRAKYECNEELAELIRLANLVSDTPKYSVDEAISQIRAENPIYLSDLSIQMNWYEFSSKLPETVINFIYSSNEFIEHLKSRSWEYWSRNDGKAQDKLLDLVADEQISEETYDKIIDFDSDDIADFLVETGIYGEDYTLAAKRKSESFSFFDRDEEDEEQIEKWDIQSFFNAQISAYERLQNIREFLLSIIKLAENIDIFTESEDIDDSYIKLKQRNFERSAFTELTKKKLLDKVLATTVTFNNKGEIKFSISDWASILQGTEVRRIRLCEVCKNIFWAKRKDAFACSKQHAKVRQMRLLRENWQQSSGLYLKARQKKAKQISDKTNPPKDI